MSVNGRGKFTEYPWYPRFFAECFIYDTFVVMNLFRPGCCNLLRLELAPAQRHERQEISLSGYYFDEAFLRSIEGKWPLVNALPIDKIADWYARVRSGVSQIANSRMERVVFAVMHICKGDSSPETVIWISHALETLFDTQPGVNVRSLLRRVSLLLQPNAPELAYLKKSFEEFYSLRSAFVHGGLQVGHPLHTEAVDMRVEGQYRRLLDANQFGFRLLIASLQRVIANGWVEPQFSETVTGDSL